MSANQVLQGLCRELGCDVASAGGWVEIRGADPVTPSTHRIGEASAAALAAFGVEAAALWRERGGEAQNVTVSVEAAARQLMAIFFTQVNGVRVAELMEDPNLLGNSDFYPSATGRHVYVLLSYPQLRDIACETLQCPPSREAFAKAIAQWDPFELEEAINAAGGTAVAVRTQAEWRDHPQGRVLLDSPLINIDKLDSGPPEPFPSHVPLGGPLSGLRVLDNTHVIAGPIAGRLAAELGADVLHMSTPGHPDPNAMIIETGMGKRAAFCDLLDPEQAVDFWRVLLGSDVYMTNYLNLDSKGFGTSELVAARPGLVALEYHGWGADGPWSRRGGFDQLACAATGFSAEEGGFDEPKLPPTYLLNDYLAGVLGAAGVIEALRRRAREGGSYRVHIDLAKVCMWVQDMGLFSREELRDVPEPGLAAAAADLTTAHGPFGAVSYLPTQVAFSTLTTKLGQGAEPLGSSPFTWLPR